MSSIRKRKLGELSDSGSEGEPEEGAGGYICTAAEEPLESYLDLSYWASTYAYKSLPRTISLSPLFSAPLTEDNLLAYDETMPAKANGDGATTASSSMNVSTAFRILKLNNILVGHEDEIAEERCQDVLGEANKIVGRSRHSQMTDSEAEALRKTASKLSQDDELTFMAGVWKLLISTHRTVALEDRQDMEDYVERAWEKDNLKCNWSSPFMANIAPPLSFADPDATALLDILPKLKNAFPDLTYGYDEETFTLEQLAVNETLQANLCKKNWHAFLLGEAKSVDQPFEIGVAQAARAVATAIHLKRKLNEQAKTPIVADPGTSKSKSGSKGDGSVVADSGTSKTSSKDKTSVVADSGSRDTPHNATSNTATLQHGTNSTVPTSSADVRGPNHIYKADMSSFMFTFVIAPEKARLFVAWAEEEWHDTNNKPGVKTHMHKLRSYYFEEGAERWANFHHDLDNVLDWGVGPRKTEVLNLLNNISNKKKEGKKRARS